MHTHFPTLCPSAYLSLYVFEHNACLQYANIFTLSSYRLADILLQIQCQTDWMPAFKLKKSDAQHIMMFHWAQDDGIAWTSPLHNVFVCRKENRKNTTLHKNTTSDLYFTIAGQKLKGMMFWGQKLPKDLIKD